MWLFLTLLANSQHIAPFSLAQEDYRHVVDAHLLNENMVVVGYDKGPIQISCIALDKKVSGNPSCLV